MGPASLHCRSTIDRAQTLGSFVGDGSAVRSAAPHPEARMFAMFLSIFALAGSLQVQAAAVGRAGNYTIHNFQFTSGETMADLRIHYLTFGEPRRAGNGTVENAVLIMHGTTGSGSGFTSRTFAGELFGPGQLFDTATHYVILPDAIGHGQSSKPSDGLHARFPHYTYDDMVEADYRTITDGLKVNHLMVVMGTSMGAMHTWVWGEKYPDFMDALVPLASAPTQIAGRNRMMRKMIMDDVTQDPEYKGGEYTAPPLRGLRAALGMMFMMTSSPLTQHRSAPTRDAADASIESYLKRAETTDANDFLYAFNASRDYDPSARLGTIKAPLLAINSADDVVNPPELGLLDSLIKRVPRGRYLLIPTSAATRGHGTHSLPAIWKAQLGAFLKENHVGSGIPGAM
jgi:homoserine O-acetyltransferase/O-succinyltransferase